jgi:hypothetical protein
MKFTPEELANIFKKVPTNELISALAIALDFHEAAIEELKTRGIKDYLVAIAESKQHKIAEE